MSVKIILSLPDELASRMRSVIPLSEIDSVIGALLEKEISIREKALYLTAKEVEEDTELKQEMALWEDACVGDGLDNMDDYYLSSEVLERTRKGQEKIYSSEEIRKNLELDKEEQDILSAFETGKLEPIPNSKKEVTRLTRIFKAAENKTSRVSGQLTKRKK